MNFQVDKQQEHESPCGVLTWPTVAEFLCGGLTLARQKVLTKSSLALPSLVGEGREIMTKG